MKYCSKCGTEMQEDAKFCTKCGKPFSKEVVMQQKKKEHKVNKKTVYALFGTLGFLLLIVLGVLFYSGYKEGREARLVHETKKTTDIAKKSAQSFSLEGNIAKYGIVVHLEKATEGSLSGWCYYKRYGSSRKLILKGNSSGNNYTFSEYVNGESVSFFDLTYNSTQHRFYGTHTNYNNGKTLDVDLRETNY